MSMQNRTLSIISYLLVAASTAMTGCSGDAETGQIDVPKIEGAVGSVTRARAMRTAETARARTGNATWTPPSPARPRR